MPLHVCSAKQLFLKPEYNCFARETNQAFKNTFKSSDAKQKIQKFVSPKSFTWIKYAEIGVIHGHSVSMQDDVLKQ